MQLSKRAELLLFLIWIQTLLATGGSLFYSEVLGFIPCEFCWIQRIFMYPLVIIYGMAILKRDKSIALPGIIWSGIGVCFSTYHYILQKLPVLQASGNSCGDIPCTLQYVNYFGFITIPFLAGIAFIVIIIGHLLLLKEGKKDEK